MGFMGVRIRTKGKKEFCFVGLWYIIIKEGTVLQYSTVQYSSSTVIIYDISVIEP